MISLDQILLLQEKVENAVAKIAQLNAENAALRRKCAELTNALAAETEQFSAFQNNQSKIEEGILSALKKLDTVESKVLETSAAAVSSSSESNSDSVSAEKTENPQNSENIENSASLSEQISAPAESNIPPEENVADSLQHEKDEPAVSSVVNSDSVENSTSVEKSDNLALNSNPAELTSENPQNSQENSPSQPMFDIF